MKKVLKLTTTALLILTIILSLTGCGEIKKAENTVNGMFAALKESNAEKVSEYMDLEDFKSSDEGDDTVNDTVTANSKLLIENMFKQLDYKIISSEKKDSSTVVVTAEITNTDMKPVMGAFFAGALQYTFANAFANPQPTEEEIAKKMEELLIASVTKPDLATVTNTADITVVKTEDKSWRIKSDDAFLNALLGGLYEATEELENSFSE